MIGMNMLERENINSDKKERRGKRVCHYVRLIRSDIQTNDDTMHSIQSHSSELFQVSIHPFINIGRIYLRLIEKIKRQ